MRDLMVKPIVSARVDDGDDADIAQLLAAPARGDASARLGLEAATNQSARFRWRSMIDRRASAAHLPGARMRRPLAMQMAASLISRARARAR